MKSLADNISSKDVTHSPFPFLAKKGVVDSAMTADLLKNYPFSLIKKDDLKKNNFRFNFHYKDVEQNPELPKVWKDFLEYHNSQAFGHQLLNLFESDISKLYPQFMNRFPSLEKVRIGRRGVDTFQNHDLLIETMISGNTPVLKSNSVRGPHIDSPRKLISGLFYIRDEVNDSKGGSLELNQIKDGEKLEFYNNVYVENEKAEPFKTITYEHNSLVLFVNTPSSIHSVTPREIGTSVRTFVNIVLEAKDPFFTIDQYQNKFDLVLRKLKVRTYSKDNGMPVRRFL